MRGADPNINLLPFPIPLFPLSMVCESRVLRSFYIEQEHSTTLPLSETKLSSFIDSPKQQSYATMASSVPLTQPSAPAQQSQSQASLPAQRTSSRSPLADGRECNVILFGLPDLSSSSLIWRHSTLISQIAASSSFSLTCCALSQFFSLPLCPLCVSLF